MQRKISESYIKKYKNVAKAKQMNKNKQMMALDRRKRGNSPRREKGTPFFSLFGIKLPLFANNKNKNICKEWNFFERE